MTSLIKNQILKHLSKFAKNLSHDQIHLSALKGEGELKNLELNEEILTDLLELPNWLRLSKATCNRVSVRIQWTKLKSVPIQLSLDEVRVEIETCEDLRAMNSGGKNAPAVPSYATGSPYGFSDKVVDGITLTVNSVILTLKSHAFTASIQISRIMVESKSPTWQKVDLRMTRIKDTDKGELLIFKELSWQTVRIEAKSTINEDLTPLRLITNQARCRITIKKKISDCSVLGCRLVLILDDLLWVLTDDQLKAALHYADSLSGLLKRATVETQKTKGARKLQSLSEFHSSQSKEKNVKSGKKAGQSHCVSAKVFARYDVVETSYHFYSDRIDLHLCDDPGGKGRSCHPMLVDGGAFQVSLSQLQVDFYPYHLATAAGDRSSWIRYPPGSVHSVWLENSLRMFQAALLEAANRALSINTTSNLHVPLARAGKCQPQNTSLPNTSDSSSNEVKNMLISQYQKLMTTNLVVRLNNFAMWNVSTSKGKVAPKEFISGDRERFSLPDDMPVMHFEYTQFYYPGDMEFPLPPPKLFAYFNPIQLSVDPLTVLWLNAFALNLQRSVKMLSVEQAEPPYLDVKIEAIMLRIILESEEDAYVRQKDRPRAMHVQASRILAANYRSLETGTKADLASCLNKFQESELFFGTDYPNRPGDIPILCDQIVDHATKEEMPNYVSQTSESGNRVLWPIMKKDLLWNESRDIWHLYLDPLWADFHGTRSTGARPVPLVDAFPLDIWLYKEPEDQAPKTSPTEKAKMHVLVQINNIVSVQLNHYQLLYLMRLLETLGEITTFLTQDVKHVLGEDDESSMVLGLIAPQFDVSLLMPSISQSKDNIGGDYDTTSAQETTSMYTMGDLGKGDDETRASSPSQSLTVDSQSTTPRPGSPNQLPIPFANEGFELTTSAPVSPSKPRVKEPEIVNSSGKKQSNESKNIKKKNMLASSLSNMMSQLGNANPSSVQAASASEEDLISVKSDDSGDSEAFIVINQAGDESVDSTLFAIHSKRASPVELAAEVTEDDLSVASTPSRRNDLPNGGQGDSSITREGNISVATFHLGGIELTQQSIGSRSCIKLRCSSLYGEECPTISWEEFQSKFSMRGKNKYESLPPSNIWCFKLRFNTTSPDYREMLAHANLETATMSLKEKISRSADAYLDLKAQNLPLQFYMSTLIGLVDLVEDEIIPSPIPMEIHLENIALHLIEDRPSPNVTSPGSLPIDLAIPALIITRDKTGMFSFQPTDYQSDGSKSIAHVSLPEVSKQTAAMSHHLDLVRSGVASIETELQQRASLLAVDNANLRGLLETSKSEIIELKAKVRELELTQKTLVKTQKKVVSMETENKSLRQTLQYLQQELVKSGKRNVVP